MIKKQWVGFQYQVNLLSRRERVAVFVMAVVVVVFVWDLFVFEAHSRWLKQNAKRVAIEQKQLTLFQTEDKRIKEAVKDVRNLAHIKNISALKREMNKMNVEMLSYRKKVISAKQVAKVIYAVLKDIKDVELQAFMTTNNTEDGLSEEKKALEVKNLSVVPKFYYLTLKGRYGAVYQYLQRIEKLGWQFYWDSFDYQVRQYPNAVVMVKFHTLSEAHEN